MSRVEAAGAPSEHFIQITNGDAGAAVDLSGFKITKTGGGGGGGEDGKDGQEAWALPPGLVLPAGGSAYLTASPAGFRARGASPKGGEGLLVVEAPARLLRAAAAAPGGVDGWSVTAP